MLRLLIVAQESGGLDELSAQIAGSGFACSSVPYGDELGEAVIAYRPDLVLVEMDGRAFAAEIEAVVQGIKKARRLPVMVLLPEGLLKDLGGQLVIDDFVTSPYDPREIALRARRLIHRAKNGASGELIECDGLVINLARCEVSVEGRMVELTFKEYELLKLLAANSGRVYSREALLDQVWGYDYYGGDRTVDVHVRRLRSKIEDASHTFIETVRNVGYRFKKTPKALQ
jgi:two-component system alkaline phosphatase synthesis response regulator PhoP